jgi:hypothetical protein
MKAEHNGERSDRFIESQEAPAMGEHNLNGLASDGLNRFGVPEYWSVGVLGERKKQRFREIENVKSQMPNQILMSNDKKERVIDFWIWNFDIHLTCRFWHLAWIHGDFAKTHFFDPNIPLFQNSFDPSLHHGSR